jgi:hypothetical protein
MAQVGMPNELIQLYHLVLEAEDAARPDGDLVALRGGAAGRGVRAERKRVDQLVVVVVETGEVG